MNFEHSVDLLLISCSVAALINVGRAEIVTSLGPKLPMGLFLPIDAWDAAYTNTKMKLWLDYICRNHRTPTGPNQFINDIVIAVIAKTDTIVSPYANPPDPATNDVLLWDRLEPLLPYFPGGNGTCHFDRVFIGTLTTDGSHAPNESWVIDPMVDGNYRANLRIRQKAIAQKFVAKVQASANANVKWEWYVAPEMCMDYVNFDYYGSSTDPKITEGWTDYLSKHIPDLNAVRSGRQFLWSPMFDNVPDYYPSVSIAYIKERLGYMFSTLAKNLATAMPSTCSNALSCPLTVAPQDHVGLASPSSVKNYTKEDALYWLNLVKPVFPFQNWTVNVEQFIYNTLPKPDAYHDADCQEIAVREQFYASQGYKLGPAWAIHMWYTCNHPGQPICPTGWTQFNQYCYKKYHEGKTWMQANASCALQQAQLVSIHSKAENDFIVALNRNASMESSIWTGYYWPMVYTYKGFPSEPFMGTDNGTILFRWSDGKPRDYWNWTPGWPQPQGYPINTTCATCGANCVAIYPANGGGQWGNAGCDWWAGAYVCKKAAQIV